MIKLCPKSLFFIFFNFVASAEGLNVLIVSACQSGHITPLSGVQRELAERGHGVELFMGDDCCEKAEKFYKNVTKCGSLPLFSVDHITVSNPIEALLDPVITQMMANNGTNLTFFKISDHIKNSDQKYDVVLHDFFFTGANLAAKFHNIPVVAFYPGPLIMETVDEPGTQKSLLYFPETSLPDFVIKIFDALSSYMWHKFVSSGIYRFVIQIEKDFEIKPYFKDNHVDFILPFSYYYLHSVLIVMGPPSLIVPTDSYLEKENNIYPIGFIPDDKYFKPLDDKLVKFLEKAKRPVIYMSLGTVFQLPFDQLEVVYSELADQKSYSIIWSASTGFYEDLKKVDRGSENLQLVSGVAQMTLLTREEVKVFITHAGANSFQEGIYSEVPMLVFPGFGDQPHNARELVENGMALPLTSLASKEICNKIDKILTADTYKGMKRNLRKTKIFMKSFGGFPRAVEVIEAAARREIDVRKPPPLYNILNDQIVIVYSVFAVVLTALLVTFGTVIYFCCRCCAKPRKAKTH